MEPCSCDRALRRVARPRQPIVVAVNQVIAAAIDSGASDIHLNPDEHCLHLRYRIDGVLQSQQAPDLSIHPGMIQRLKVMAQLDLTQTRRPQDGKFRFMHNDQAIDVRLSLLPTVYGENAVLRGDGSREVVPGNSESSLAAGDAFEMLTPGGGGWGSGGSR